MEHAEAAEPPLANAAAVGTPAAGPAQPAEGPKAQSIALVEDDVFSAAPRAKPRGRGRSGSGGGGFIETERDRLIRTVLTFAPLIQHIDCKEQRPARASLHLLVLPGQRPKPSVASKLCCEVSQSSTTDCCNRASSRRSRAWTALSAASSSRRGKMAHGRACDPASDPAPQVATDGCDQKGSSPIRPKWRFTHFEATASD